MEQPPDDPEVWSDDQWIAWLDEAGDDEPTGERAYAPMLDSPTATVVGAAMIGLHHGMFGDIEKPEIVVEIGARGKDDGTKVDLDPDDPSHSTVVIAAPAQEARPD
jgi:hypothetical protein